MSISYALQAQDRWGDGMQTLLSVNFRLISAHLCGKNIQTICLNATCDMRLLNRDRVSCDALQHKLRSGLGVFYVHTVILV